MKFCKTICLRERQWESLSEEEKDMVRVLCFYSDDYTYSVQNIAQMFNLNVNAIRSVKSGASKKNATVKQMITALQSWS